MPAIKTWVHKIQALGERVYRPFLKIKNLQLRAAWVSLVLTAVIWFAASLIIGLAPFGNESLCTNDGYAQYMPFLSEFWSVFREGGSMLYSWHGALGSNFYLTMAYYLFSPFSFLVLLFDKAQIPSAANLIIILKNMLVIAIMAWYLAGKGKKPNVALSVSCAMAYGFGFYFLGYAVNFMWMDSIALTPLMLYGLERLDTRKGRWFYLLSLAGAILMNFYMGAILCIFLFLYFVVIEWRWSKEGWKTAGWFAACSICAALCAGIVLLPVVYGMFGANASRMSPPDFEVFNDWKYFFSRLLPDAGVVRITHNRGTINLYMGTGVLYGCLLYFFSKQPSRRTKYGLLFLCLLYLAATQISWLNYAFHGFYMQRQVPNRFAFLVVFLAAIMMEQGFMALGRLKFWKIGLCGGLCAIYFGAVVWLTDSDQIWLAFLLPAVCILYLLAGLFRKRQLVSLLIAIESIIGLVMVAPGSLDESFTNMSAYIEAARMTPGGRAEIVCSDIANAPTLYGMNGISAFNSVINPKTAALLGKLGFASGENYYRFFGYNPLSALFFNVRSITTGKNADLPYPFVKTVEVQNMEVWTSPYEIPIGLCLENPDVLLSSANKFENNNELFPGSFLPYELTGTGSGDSTFVREEGTYKFTDIKADDLNTLTLDPIEADNLYIYAKVDGTKKFSVTRNGKLVAENKYEGNMVFVGDVLPQDKIQISFRAENDKNEATVKLQGATLANAKVEEAAEYLIANGLQNESINKNVITGTYHTDQERTMIFTVPFDEGWKATINGQPVPTTAWQEALVSIQVPAGESEIKLVYIPAGLVEGAVASGIGVMMALVILAGPSVNDWKKRKSKSAAQDQPGSEDRQPGDQGFDHFEVDFGGSRPSTVVDLSEIRDEIPARLHKPLQTIFDKPETETVQEASSSLDLADEQAENQSELKPEAAGDGNEMASQEQKPADETAEKKDDQPQDEAAGIEGRPGEKPASAQDQPDSKSLETSAQSQDERQSESSSRRLEEKPMLEPAAKPELHLDQSEMETEPANGQAAQDLREAKDRFDADAKSGMAASAGLAENQEQAAAKKEEAQACQTADEQKMGLLLSQEDSIQENLDEKSLDQQDLPEKAHSKKTQSEERESAKN